MIDFDKLIDQYLHREKRPKSIGRYYPSEIGYCMRKVWFSYKYPMETEKDLIRIFHLGNILHDFIVSVLKSEKNPEVELLETELPFRMNIDDFIISGRIDDLVLVKEDNRKFLVEVKSTRSVDAITEPVHTHLVQLQLYMHAMGIHDGIILYVEKNNLHSKTFEVKFDEEIAKQAVQRFKTLHEHLKLNKVPEAEAKNNEKIKWMCKYCEYKDRCEFVEESKKLNPIPIEKTEKECSTDSATRNTSHASEKLKTLDMF
jgi:CRISPR-associated exonuclease Cas4